MKRSLLLSPICWLVCVFALRSGAAIPPAGAQTASPEPIPLIVDDDGSADGMVGLLCVLRDPRYTVRAVTISAGLAHPDVFAPLAARMLARIGRSDIPVAAGHLTPLTGANAFPEAWRADTDRFWGVALPADPVALSPLPAAELIAQTVAAAPQPVVLLVTGPLTNLAEALRLHPEIAGKIRAVHVMGGAVWTGGNIHREWPAINNAVAEWNIWADAVAAQEVFSSGLPVRLVPLDVTNQVVMNRNDLRAWRAAGTPEGELAAELLEYLLHQISPTGCSVWDAVAAIDLCCPEVCTAEAVRIEVVTTPGPEEGWTVPVGAIDATVAACRYVAPARARLEVEQALTRPLP